MFGFLWWHLKVRLSQQIGTQNVLWVTPSPVSLQSLWNIGSPTCDLGPGLSCNENIDLCISALNLAYVGLSYCCRFCANIFSVDSLQVPLNLVVTMRSRLGPPPWEDQVALLSRAKAPHGHRLPSECSCCLRGLCSSHKGPKPEVPMTWNLWIHHWEVAKHSVHAKHVLDTGNTVVKRTVLCSWPLYHIYLNITLVCSHSYVSEKRESCCTWWSLLESRDSLGWPRKCCLGKTYLLEADFQCYL